MLLSVVLLRCTIRSKGCLKYSFMRHWVCIRTPSECTQDVLHSKGRPSKEASLCYVFECATEIFGNCWEKKRKGGMAPAAGNTATKSPVTRRVNRTTMKHNSLRSARSRASLLFPTGHLQPPGVQSEPREIESRSGLCKAGAGFLKG